MDKNVKDNYTPMSENKGSFVKEFLDKSYEDDQMGYSDSHQDDSYQSPSRNSTQKNLDSSETHINNNIERSKIDTQPDLTYDKFESFDNTGNDISQLNDSYTNNKDQTQNDGLRKENLKSSLDKDNLNNSKNDIDEQDPLKQIPDSDNEIKIHPTGSQNKNTESLTNYLGKLQKSKIYDNNITKDFSNKINKKQKQNILNINKNLKEAQNNTQIQIVNNNKIEKADSEYLNSKIKEKEEAEVELEKKKDPIKQIPNSDNEIETHPTRSNKNTDSLTNYLDELQKTKIIDNDIRKDFSFRIEKKQLKNLININKRINEAQNKTQIITNNHIEKSEADYLNTKIKEKEKEEQEKKKDLIKQKPNSDNEIETNPTGFHNKNTESLTSYLDKLQNTLIIDDEIRKDFYYRIDKKQMQNVININKNLKEAQNNIQIITNNKIEKAEADYLKSKINEKEEEKKNTLNEDKGLDSSVIPESQKTQDIKANAIDDEIFISDNKNNNFIDGLEREFQKIKNGKAIEKPFTCPKKYHSSNDSNSLHNSFDADYKGPRRLSSLNTTFNSPVKYQYNNNKNKSNSLFSFKKDDVGTLYNNFDATDKIIRSIDELKNMTVKTLNKNASVFQNKGIKNDDFLSKSLQNKQSKIKLRSNISSLLNSDNNVKVVKSNKNENDGLNFSEAAVISNLNLDMKNKEFDKNLDSVFSKLSSNFDSSLNSFIKEPFNKLTQGRDEMKKNNLILSSFNSNTLNKLKMDSLPNEHNLRKNELLENLMEIKIDYKDHKFLDQGDINKIKQISNNDCNNVSFPNKKIYKNNLNFKFSKEDICKNSGKIKSDYKNNIQRVASERNSLGKDQLDSIISDILAIINKHETKFTDDIKDLNNKLTMDSNLEVKNINPKFDTKKSVEMNASIAEKLSSYDKIINLKSDRIPNDLVITDSPLNNFPISELETFTRSLSQKYSNDAIDKMANGKMKFNKQTIINNNKKTQENIKNISKFDEIKQSDLQSLLTIINEPEIFNCDKDIVLPFKDHNEKIFAHFNFFLSSNSNNSILNNIPSKIQVKNNLKHIQEKNLKFKNNLNNIFDNVKRNKNSIDSNEIQNSFIKIYSDTKSPEDNKSSKGFDIGQIEKFFDSFKTILNKNDDKSFPFNLDVNKMSANYNKKIIENNRNLEQNLNKLQINDFSKAAVINDEDSISDLEIVSVSNNKNSNKDIFDIFDESKRDDDNLGKFLKNKTLKLNKNKNLFDNLCLAVKKENRNSVSDDDFMRLIKDHNEEESLMENIIQKRLEDYSLSRKDIEMFPYDLIKKMPLLNQKSLKLNEKNICLAKERIDSFNIQLGKIKLIASQKALLDEAQFMDEVLKTSESKEETKTNDEVIERTSYDHQDLSGLLKNIQFNNFSCNKLINKSGKFSFHNNHLPNKNLSRNFKEDLLKNNNNSDKEDNESALAKAFNDIEERESILEVKDFTKFDLMDSSKITNSLIDTCNLIGKSNESIFKTSFNFNKNSKPIKIGVMNRGNSIKATSNESVIDCHVMDSLNQDVIKHVKGIKIKNIIVNEIERSRNDILNLKFDKDNFFFIKFKIDYYKMIKSIKDFLEDKEFKKDLKLKVISEVDENRSNELEESIKLAIDLVNCSDVNNPIFKGIIVASFKNASSFILEKIKFISELKEEFNLLRNWSSERQKQKNNKEGIDDALKVLEEKKNSMISSYNDLEKNIHESSNKLLSLNENFLKFEIYLSQNLERKCDDCIENELPVINRRLENIEFSSVLTKLLEDAYTYCKGEGNKNNTEKRNYLTNLFEEREKLLPKNKPFQNNMVLIKDKLLILYKDDKKEDRKENEKITNQAKVLNDHIKNLEEQNKQTEHNKKIHERKIGSLKMEIIDSTQSYQNENSYFENERRELVGYWENIIKNVLLFVFLLFALKLMINRFAL